MYRKLNVGIFTHDFYPFIGGQGRHVYELYRQNQKKNSINFLVFSPSDNDFPNHKQIFPETRTNKLRNLEFSFRLNTKLSSLIDTYKLDIIHFHGGPGGLFSFRKPRIPFIYTCHHTYWQQYQYVLSQQWKIFFSFLEKKSYKFADRIICVSNDTLNILQSYYGIEANRLQHIPNGVNVKKNSNNGHIQKNNKELLYVGRIDKRKGVDFLVRSMRLVNKKNPLLRLHIVGEGIDKTALENFSRQNNLNIIFHGFLSDRELGKLYKIVSIQIVPSVFEGFGISAIEGMSYGVPIIATAVDGLREIIQHNKDGILVSFGNEEQLSDAILKLLPNQKQQLLLAKNAFNKIKRFSWIKNYQQTIALYENLIA